MGRKSRERSGHVERAREAGWPWHPTRIERYADVAEEARTTEAYRTRRSANDRILSVDYSFASSRTHQTLKIRECRGLIFEAVSGRVAARPPHKFFNLGERVDDDTNVDWSQPHTVTEKVDGSLFYPAELEDGTVLWCTRGGTTDKAAEAQAAWHEETRRSIETTMLRHEGIPVTPSFEYIGPQNRVVVSYGKAEILLLAVRERESGRYLTPEEVEELSRDARSHGLHVAAGVAERSKRWQDATAREQAIAKVRSRDRGEGVVIAFDSGYRIKLKNVRYIAIHRVVSGLGFETHVLQGVLQDNADDWIGTLPAEDAQALREYAEQVQSCVRRVAEEVADEVATLYARYPQRRDFAKAWSTSQGSDPVLRPLGFELVDALEKGQEADATKAQTRLREIIARKANRQERLEREVHGGTMGFPRWTPRGPDAPS